MSEKTGILLLETEQELVQARKLLVGRNLQIKYVEKMLLEEVLSVNQIIYGKDLNALPSELLNEKAIWAYKQESGHCRIYNVKQIHTNWSGIKRVPE